MVKERKEVKVEDRWNVEALYLNDQAWEKAFDAVKREGKKPLWPELVQYKGKLGEGPATLKKALETYFAIARQLEKIYVYAHLRHDEDIADDTHKTSYERISALLHHFGEEIAWIEPELLALPEATIQEYLSSPELAPYRFHIEKIVRIRAHTLSQEKEELLALVEKALSTSNKAFKALSDADFKFNPVKDSKGIEHELTHGLFGLHVRDQDRTLRQNAYTQLHKKYGDYENTLCELINGQVQAHTFNAKSRHYESCLAAALFPKNIDTSVYTALIQAVNESLAPLHKYMTLREKLLNIKPLHLYDMNVPLTAQIDIRMPYCEAEKIVIDSVAPLGSEYQEILRKGFLEQRWVDRYENKNKRSGAYSSGCYDSLPYILMNYKEVLKDVFTLAHEAGHSMHTYYSVKNQPFHYADYPIFLAEVASTFNEELLMRMLMQKAKTKEEKFFLVNQKIEDIRNTLFRQTMFAEFELKIHQMAEQDIPLTPRLLKEEYSQLNAKYFGPSVVIDSNAEVEWARIPHFYYNFYVFQYATGISAALALADRVMNGGNSERDAYLAFLKCGSSKYPIETLQIAGVDMRTPEPVKAAIRKFDHLVDELIKIGNL
jgi:oligoendopeptidase F